MPTAMLDVFGVLILAYNVLRGVTNGLIRTSVGMIAMVAASYMAWQHAELVAPLLDPLLGAGSSMAILARPAATWVLTFLVINTLGILLRLGVSVTPLVIADRIGGGLFGLFAGLAMLLTPMLIVASFPLLQQIPQIQQAFGGSVLAGMLSPLVTLLLALFPLVRP